MDKHKFRLRWMMVAYSAVVLLVAAISLPLVFEQIEQVNHSIYGEDGLNPFQWFVALFPFSIVAILVVGSGYIVITKSVVNTPVLIMAAVMLLSFPVGTCLAVYYFWYRFYFLDKTTGQLD